MTINKIELILVIKKKDKLNDFLFVLL
jgi:hypothetical protein